MSVKPDPRDALLDACARGDADTLGALLATHPGLRAWPAIAALAQAYPHDESPRPPSILAHTGHALELAHRARIESTRVRLALLFHDVGHADARRAGLYDRTGGRTVHQARGATRARYLLHGTRVSHALRREIAALVALHRAPRALSEALALGDEARVRTLLERLATCVTLEDLCALAECDAQALDATRRAPALEQAQLLRMAAEEHRVLKGPPEPWLDESDPALRRVRFAQPLAKTYALAEVRRRRLEGTLTSREQALGFCHTQAQRAPADVVLTVGISGSGKSHALEALRTTHEIVSTDDERERRYGDASTQGNPGEIHHACVEKLVHALRRGARVAYDATNVRFELRERVLRVCHAYGAHVTLYAFDTPIDTALERNRRRERVVPEAVVHRQAASFDWPRPWEAHAMRVFDEGAPA